MPPDNFEPKFGRIRNPNAQRNPRTDHRARRQECRQTDAAPEPHFTRRSERTRSGRSRSCAHLDCRRPSDRVSVSSEDDQTPITDDGLAGWQLELMSLGLSQHLLGSPCSQSATWGFGDFLDQLPNQQLAKSLKALRLDHECPRPADDIILIIGGEAPGWIGMQGIGRQRNFAQDGQTVDGHAFCYRLVPRPRFLAAGVVCSIT
jgi:hypothetical protein